MYQLKKLQTLLHTLLLLSLNSRTQETKQTTKQTNQTTTTSSTTTTTTPAINIPTTNVTNIGDGEHEFGAAPISDILRLPEAVDADRVFEESSRHFLCIPLLRIFNLELQRPLSTGEHIGLIGSHRRLGEWQIERSLEMRSLDGERLEWLAKVPICASERIAYRYFIYTLDLEQRRRVRSWEGQLHPRIMESYEIYRQPGIDYFGDTTHPALSGAGEESNWLRYERLIEFKFIWQRHFRFERNSKPKASKIRLKLQQFARKLNNVDTLIEYTRFAYNASKFRAQNRNGVVYELDSVDQRNKIPHGDPAENNILIFRIFEPLRLRQTFKLSLMSLNQRPLADIIIWSEDLKGSEGILHLPIHSTNTGFEIGHLTLPYLIVNPLPHAELLDMRGSYQHFWPLNWPTMHVGNRGAGQSFYDYEAPYIEHTVKSFLYAFKFKAEMISMDIQLTKDYVPVLWHEFGFYTAPKQRQVESLLDLDYILIQNLNYRELRQKRVFVMKSPMEGLEELTHLNVQRPKMLKQIFPKLATVFNRLPRTLGFIINVQWSQLLQHGKTEAGTPNFLDKNLYVDTLIATTARWGCGRPLIFTSLDADICSMLSYKQNLYPVIFKTAGRAQSWQPYKDLRTRTYMNAVNFVQAENLMGTATHVGNFLKAITSSKTSTTSSSTTPSTILRHQLNLGSNLLQVNFLWGEELSDKEILEKFQDLGVTGLIYDRLDLHRPFKQRLEFFAAKELNEVFERSCSSALRNASVGIETKGGSKTRRKVITIHIEA